MAAGVDNPRRSASPVLRSPYQVPPSTFSAAVPCLESGKVMNHAMAYRYDSKTNVWTTIHKLPAANRGLSAVATAKRYIYLFGGYTDSGFSSEVLLYDIEKDSYSRLKPMPVGLLGIEFVLNGHSIYGAGGEDRMRGRSPRLLQGTLKETAR